MNLHHPWLVCQHCGYDLNGLPENRCPECGEAFDPDQLKACFETRSALGSNAASVLRHLVYVFTLFVGCALVGPTIASLFYLKHEDRWRRGVIDDYYWVFVYVPILVFATVGATLFVRFQRLHARNMAWRATTRTNSPLERPLLLGSYLLLLTIGVLALRGCLTEVIRFD